MADTDMNYMPDEIDLKIINILNKNARTKAKDIAKEVNVTATTVATRIERLEQSKIIAGYNVKIDHIKAGYAVKAFINLAVEPDRKSEFYSYIEKCKNVIECNCVTGEFSMLLEVVFQSTGALDTFVGELQRFGKTKTQIVFSTCVEHRNEFLK